MRKYQVKLVINRLYQTQANNKKEAIAKAKHLAGYRHKETQTVFKFPMEDVTRLPDDADVPIRFYSGEGIEA